MEEIKFQTEFRKQRSQALEKTERLKKKSRISEKKDQKAEVKRKIENSLPVVPPLDQAFHCSGCTNTHSWRGWLCIDDQKHQREWMVKERRLMVKDAFQEQAKAVNGFSKLRKQGAAKKFAFSSDDLDDDCISEEEEYDNEETWQKPAEMLKDLSAFLVTNRGEKQRPRKQTIRLFSEQFDKPRPIVIESEERMTDDICDIPSDLFNLLDKLDFQENGVEERQDHILLHTDSFSCVCPESWSRAYGASLPPTMMLEHKQRDLTLMVAEVDKRHHVAVCSATLVKDSSSSGSRVCLNLPRHKLLTLSNLCHLASGAGASFRRKKSPLTTEVAQIERREVHQEDSWSMVDHQEEPWEMVDIEANNSVEPLPNSLCGICLEITHHLLALAGCRHSFCHQCWSQYLVANVSVDTTLPLRCPETCCSQLVDLVTAAFILLFRHHSNFNTWQTLLKLTIKALPLYICHRCHRPSYLNDRTHCPCGELRCLACGLRDHWPALCPDFALSLQLAKEDLSSRRIEVLFRSCPRCHECWEKTYGCNHMVCTRCRTSFCWGCGRQGSHHSGGYCGDMELPLERKLLYTSGLFGLSSERLDAIELGLKKLTASPLPGSCLPQARQVARDVVGKCQPEFWFKHTRRGNNNLHLLPSFAKVEDVVEKALASCRRGGQFTQFGYFLGASELQEVQLSLRRLEGDLKQVEQLMQVEICNPRSIEDWMAKLVSATARIDEKMTSIGK